MKWRYFLVAILVVGYAMLAVGAPLVAVVAGVALAALLNLKQQGGLKLQRPKKSPTPITPPTPAPAVRAANS
jgi:hypothetical protein